MYALDTNILVYAHNIGVAKHEQAKTFVQDVMNRRDNEGHLSVCIPAQVLLEFLNVITWNRLETPLPLNEALQIVQDYLGTGATILHPKETHIFTVLELLQSVKSRKRIFDVALAATLKDHGISGLYTVNTDDFKDFAFLEVKNPLSSE